MTVYGERWQACSTKPMAKGCGGEIYRVIDLQDEFEGEYALKRVDRPKRHERFSREIGAVTLIRHPNVIGLADDSAFRSGSGEGKKSYLVMPIAEGGDLGHEGRAKVYKGSLDAVIQAGKQLASALLVAHAAGVIHRDLKPSNVLFTGLGQEIWVSDFGICLIRERPRRADEGVPFLAPELEGGQQLDVTPAADVYSLGAVLFFMYSGGRMVAGPTMSSSRYESMFQASKRDRQLLALLLQMVCPLEDRLKTMPEVLTRLEAMETRG